MRAAPALALTLAALPALAEPRIEVCGIDLEATEGADVTVHSDDGDIRLVAVKLYGETQAIEMDVVPLGPGDATLRFRYLKYSRPITGTGPFEINLAETTEAVVRDGRICAGEGCFTATESLTRDWAEGLYADYLRLFPDRWDCVARYPG
jgi:hypothetical protein